MFDKVHLGMALSGGGSRGLAHIGVLKALSEIGIQPGVVSGASMGAIVASLIANGYSADELVSIATEKQHSKMFELGRPQLGFASHGPVRKILSELLPETFEELKLPLYISTTNLSSGENAVFSSGPLYDPIMASSSIPIVFKPIKIDGQYYVDGGLTENLPAKVIREKCEILIGSHVNFIDTNKNLNNIKDIAEQCFRIAVHNSVVDNKEVCDVYIDPPSLRQFGTLDFKRIPEIIEIGYQETLKVLEEKKSVLKNKSLVLRIRELLGTV